MYRTNLSIFIFCIFLLSNCSISKQASTEQINKKNINLLLNSAESYTKRHDYLSSIPFLINAYNHSLLLNQDTISSTNLAFSIAKAYYLCKNDSLFNFWLFKAKGLSIKNPDLVSSKMLFFRIDTLLMEKQYETLSEIKIPDSYSVFNDEYYLALSKVLFAGYMVNKSNSDLLNLLIEKGGNKSIYYLETKAYIWFMIAEIFSCENKNIEAEFYYHKAIEASKKTGDFSLAAIVYEKLGDLSLRYKSNKNIEYYIKSSDFYFMCNDTSKANLMLLKCKQ